jgi:hypothetical protein
VDSADVTEGSPSVVSGQGVREGYQNIKTQKEVDGLVKATLKDFKADMTYEIAMPIGTINTGTPEAPVLEQAFQLVKKTAPSETLAAAVDEYENYVRGGAAYNAQGGSVPPGTTVPGNTTIPPGTTVPPATTVPPGTVILNPLEFINCGDKTGNSEMVILEEASKLFIVAYDYTAYPQRRITIEKGYQYKLRFPIHQTSSNNPQMDVRQYDANDNVIQIDEGVFTMLYFNVLTNTKKVLLVFSGVKIANSVPSSIDRMYIGNNSSQLGTTHIIKNETGTIGQLYIIKNEPGGNIRIISQATVVLPFDIYFYKKGVLIVTASVNSNDWNSNGLFPQYSDYERWDYVSLGANTPPPAQQQFLYCTNKVVSSTEFPRINQVKINGALQGQVGFVEPGVTTGVPYDVPVGLAEIIVVAPGTGGVIRVIDSLNVSHDQPQIDGANINFVFPGIDISTGFKILLVPPGTITSPVATKKIKLKNLTTQYITIATKLNQQGSLNLNNGQAKEIFIESIDDYIRNVTGAGTPYKFTYLQADDVTLAPLESPNPEELIADFANSGDPAAQHNFNADISLLAIIRIEDVTAPTTVPPPPPEITTTVPEVTTTVPETTVPPTTVVAATASNGNGDELKELDQLVEKELEKKKTKKK